MNLNTLGSIEVLTPEGKPEYFKSLWSERPAVIALVRHFGCIFCFEQVGDLLALSKDIADAGARLCIVGNGNPLHARVFMDEAGLTEGVYTDPARLIYKGLSMRHGVLTAVNAASVRHARRAYRRGFSGRSTRGDRWQQGGVLVANTDGNVAFIQRFSVAGEPTDVNEVLLALQRCKVAR